MNLKFIASFLGNGLVVDLAPAGAPSEFINAYLLKTDVIASSILVRLAV